MSAHYLIEQHTASFSDARILDVTESADGRSLLNGGFVVRVPDYIAVRDPVGLTDPTTGLLAKKYAGILSYYAGFQQVTWDDMLDASGVNFTDPALLGTFGDRLTTSLPPSGTFVSVSVPLVGLAPAQAVVTWEVFSVETSGNPATRMTRQYKEEASSNLTCQVSFDGGAHFYTVQDGVVLNVPSIGQGTSFIVRLTNPTSNRLYIGGWAVVY